MLDGMAPELTVTDGMPPPQDLPRGECLITRLDDGRLRIDRADPRILISAELLDEIRFGRLSHYARLDLGGSSACAVAPEAPGTPVPRHATCDGTLLKIYGASRTVIYRIGEYVPRVRGYIAEWPD